MSAKVATQEFARTMSKWENFSLGFTYLSPVVGVYTLFGTSLAIGGAPFWWSYLIVGAGQFLVSLVFGEIVSVYPIAGGLYPWARRLAGWHWSWMTGWIYAFALYCSIAGTATGAAPFVAALFGVRMNAFTLTGAALAFIAAGTAVNLMGTRTLARVALFGFCCEITGAVIVGAYLLLFYRRNSISVLATIPANAHGNYMPAFLGASMAAFFTYYGFEACGDVAEEVPDAATVIPGSMRLAVLIGGGAATFVCLALILAVPDLGAVLAGGDVNPVATVMAGAFEPHVYRAVLVVLMTSFFSCILSLQAVSGRLLFAYGRDNMIVGSGVLGRLSPNTAMPVAALLVSGLVPGFLALTGVWMTNSIATIVSAASAGIYVAFLMVVIAALVARARGWRPSGSFNMGRFGGLVTWSAVLFCAGALTTILWPRAPLTPWWSNYGMLLTMGGVVVAGCLYLVAARPDLRSEGANAETWRTPAPAGASEALFIDNG